MDDAEIKAAIADAVSSQNAKIEELVSALNEAGEKIAELQTVAATVEIIGHNIDTIQADLAVLADPGESGLSTHPSLVAVPLALQEKRWLLNVAENYHFGERPQPWIIAETD